MSSKKDGYLDINENEFKLLLNPKIHALSQIQIRNNAEKNSSLYINSGFLPVNNNGYLHKQFNIYNKLMDMNNLNDIFYDVKAENGDINTYTIEVSKPPRNTVLLNNIKIINSKNIIFEVNKTCQFDVEYDISSISFDFIRKHSSQKIEINHKTNNIDTITQDFEQLKNGEDFNLVSGYHNMFYINITAPNNVDKQTIILKIYRKPSTDTSVEVTVDGILIE